MKKLLFVIMFPFFFSFADLNAQSAIVATGGNITDTGGSVSFSIGQVSYKTVSGSNGSKAEGVQQPFEISVVTAIERSDGINLEFNLFPNPATDYIKLFIATDKFTELRYELFNINGLLLKERIIEGAETEISMAGLSSATYFLKILSSNKAIKTFKIIKK
jgi:hypothetical protein